MALERTVLLDGGVALSWHRVTDVTHHYGEGSYTRVDVESFAFEGADGAHVSALVLPLTDGMDEEGAYAALAEAWPEHVDPAQAVVDALLPTLTDEQVASVSDAIAPLLPAWDEAASYRKGDLVTHYDSVWRCLQDHDAQTSWAPTDAPSLWSAVLAGQGGGEASVGEWVQPDSTNPYMRGDRVMHGGKTWTSTVDNNVWEPGVYGWDEVEESNE